MANDIEEVKRRINIVDLVSSYVTLKKAGKDFKAICPFHQEKTPSFFVSPEKQIFKCFGCGEGGDIFDFVMKQEGLEFGDALKLLADRAGVELTPRTRIDRETPGLKTRLFAINRLSALFYHKILMEHAAATGARDYLKNRGITKETIRQFLIGFAPAQGPLLTFLSRKAFTESEIEKAGRPDRFARRIMFPLFDVVGNVIGFSGRIVGSEGEPKYLNTPETALYHKGRFLYGLAQAKKAMKDTNLTVLVEGQMDVVMSHQAGVTNVVATSGTSLTDDHLQTLFRYTPNLALAFDTDAAGEKAGGKAIMMALTHGFTVKLIPLVSKDPADLVKTDPAKWKEAVGRSKEAIGYLIDRAMSKYPHPTAEQKKSVAKEILPYLAALSDPIEQETWVQTLAGRLAVSEKTVYLALSKVKPGKEVAVVSVAKKETQLTPAETLVGLVMTYPHKADRVVAELQPELLESNVLKELFLAVKKNISSLKKTPGKARETIAQSLPPDLAKRADFLVFTVMREFPDQEEVGVELGRLLDRISDTSRERLKIEFAARIAQAEKAGQRDEIKKLMNEFQVLLGRQ